jgi:hypothetical protein
MNELAIGQIRFCNTIKAWYKIIDKRHGLWAIQFLAKDSGTTHGAVFKDKELLVDRLASGLELELW